MFAARPGGMPAPRNDGWNWVFEYTPRRTAHRVIPLVALIGPPNGSGVPDADQKCSRERPVIRAGFGSPIIASSVGAMSCSEPPGMHVAGRPT